MPVSRLFRLEDSTDGVINYVRWKGMDASDDALEPLEQVYEDVPDILGKRLKRKNTTPDLDTRALRYLGI